MNKKGFTLIELLVVIAIIGILASVVLISFPGASKQAKDSRVISAISQARTVMTYVCNNEGCGAFTSTHDDMKTLWKEIERNFGDNEIDTDTTKDRGIYGKAGTTDSACIWAELNSKSKGYYCADMTGMAGSTTTDFTATYCNGTDATNGWKCPGGLTD